MFSWCICWFMVFGALRCVLWFRALDLFCYLGVGFDFRVLWFMVDVSVLYELRMVISLFAGFGYLVVW